MVVKRCILLLERSVIFYYVCISWLYTGTLAGAGAGFKVSTPCACKPGFVGVGIVNFNNPGI